MKLTHVRGKLTYYLIVAIILIAYISVTLLLPVPKNSVFWTTFAFTILSFAVYVLAVVLFASQESIRSRILGWPILKVANTYLLSQIISSLLFMLLSFFMPIWIVLIVHIIALSVALVGILSTKNVHDSILEMEDRVIEQIVFMKELTTKMLYISKVNDCAELQKTLENLHESVRYADPVSSPKLKDIEDSLMDTANLIEMRVNDKNIVEAEAACTKFGNLLSVRNEMCKNYKVDLY